jgi:hypothetical protein
MAFDASPEASTMDTMEGRVSSLGVQGHDRTSPMGIPAAPQLSHSSQPVNPMLATSNQSTGYPSMPWSFLAQTQGNNANTTYAQPQSFGMSPPPAPLPANPNNEQYTDPFLYTLLNHITLPPHLPQTDTSTGDFTFMPQTGWSPAMSTFQHQQSNPNIGYDVNANTNNASLAQLMSMASSTPAHDHDRRFSAGSGSLDTSDLRQNQSPTKEMQWNGYFGSG